jgi:predicted permease
MATAQVAIALIVLVGAGLLFASFRSISDGDLGFQPARVDTVTVSLPRTSYGKDPDVAGFEGRALAAVRAIPGVEAAGATDNVPFSSNVSNSVILAEGHDMKPGESLLAPTLATVSAGYFETLGVRLKAGRFFDARDTAEAPKTVMIDDRMANTFWPGRDPIGRRLYFPTDRKDIAKVTPDTKFLIVVGVIKEMQMLDPRKDITPIGMVFFPSQQNPQQTFTIVARTASGAGAAGSIRTALARLDPQVPVFRPRTMSEWIDQALVGRRVPMLIAVAFGLVALFLSAIGVYGVLAYGVVLRRRELGVRLALGGTAGRVFTLVLGGGLKIVGAGLVVGLVGSYFVGQLMQNQLVNVAPASPVVLVLVSVLLLTVAVIASLVPAWRASRINPIVVLSR